MTGERILSILSIFGECLIVDFVSIHLLVFVLHPSFCLWSNHDWRTYTIYIVYIW